MQFSIIIKKPKIGKKPFVIKLSVLLNLLKFYKYNINICFTFLIAVVSYVEMMAHHKARIHRNGRIFAQT